MRVTSLNLFGLILTFCAGLTYHVIANVFNSYYDWENGFDSPRGPQVVPILLDRRMGSKALYRCGLVFLIFGCCLTILLGFLYGITIFILGVVGVASAYYYTAPPIAYKYRGWSLPVVFVTMGVLLTISAYLVQTAAWSWAVLILTLPIAFLVAAILQANELRDYITDSSHGCISLTIVTGVPVGIEIYRWLLLTPYIIVVTLVITKVIAFPSLLVLLTVGQSFSLIAQAEERNLTPLVVSTAKLHATFGLTYLFGMLFR